MLLVVKLLLLPRATMGSESAGSGVAAREEEASGEWAGGKDADEGDVGPAMNPRIAAKKMWVAPRQHAAMAVHRLDAIMCTDRKDISTIRSCTKTRALVSELRGHEPVDMLIESPGQDCRTVRP